MQRDLDTNLSPEQRLEAASIALEKMNRAIRYLSAAQTLLEQAVWRSGSPERIFVWGRKVFGGNIVRPGELEGDKGKGLKIGEGLASILPAISRKAEVSSIPVRHSTLEEDRDAKFVIMPPVDFNGRPFAYDLMRKYELLISNRNDGIMLHYKGGEKDRVEYLYHMNEGSSKFLTQGARIAVAKYASSHMITDAGGFIGNPETLGKTWPTYSYGGAAMFGVQRGLHEALTTTDPDRIANINQAFTTLDPGRFSSLNWETPPYGAEKIEEIRAANRIAAIGLPLPISRGSQGAFLFPAIHVISADDSMAHQSVAMNGAIKRYGRMEEGDKPFQAFYDPEHPNRVMVLVKHGVIDSKSERGYLNFAGHEVACYVDAMTDRGKGLKPVGDIFRGLIDRDPEVLALDLRKELDAIPFDIPEFERMAATPRGHEDLIKSWARTIRDEEANFDALAISKGKEPTGHPIFRSFER